MSGPDRWHAKAEANFHANSVMILLPMTDQAIQMMECVLISEQEEDIMKEKEKGFSWMPMDVS